MKVTSVKIIEIILLALFVPCENVSGHNTFVVTFQAMENSAVSPSYNEWIEFSNKIPSSKEFTACQWIKTKFFNKDTDVSISLWAYCTIDKENHPMTCLQTFLHGNIKTASRDVFAAGYIPWVGGIETRYIEVNSFFHRRWVHFCWSVSSVTGESKFYYNGNLVGMEILSNINNTIILKSEVYDAQFIFGQEPDAMRGGFDKFQAFLGDLAELNVWSQILDEESIMKKARCKDPHTKNFLTLILCLLYKFFSKSPKQANSGI